MENTFDKTKINENVIPTIRIRRNSVRRKSQTKITTTPENKSWLSEIPSPQDLEIIEEQENQDRNSYQSSRISEYECSERSSDTGVECLSLNSRNTTTDENTQTYSDTVSSSSSLNSEEGYYSHQDSSLSTLIDENQINICKIPVGSTFMNTKRTMSFPEITKQTNFKIIKMKEQNKQLAKAEIEIFNTNFESPQMNVKYLSSIFDRSEQNLNKNLSTMTLNDSVTNIEPMKIHSCFTPQRRSVSAYKINTSTCLDKDKLLSLRFNSIRRTGSHSFRVETVKETEMLVEDEFLLRDAFGMKFLIEAEHFFGKGVRELIMKFEKK